MIQTPLKEDFIHFIWRTKRIAPADLVTTDGILVDVADYGVYNVDAGPDFFNGKIKINDTVWAGNIEMHVFSSDWHKHKHQHDEAYNNVILHVVYEHDEEVLDPTGKPIPTIALKGKIPKVVLDNYLTLVQSFNDIPCAAMIHKVEEAKIEFWKYKLTIERLNKKAEYVQTLLIQNNGDWEETLYQLLARYYGSKVNIEPFEALARSLPLSILQKNKDKKAIITALLFGQAGMLEANYQDQYFLDLKKEYDFQKSKYNLRTINKMTWKFSKLRPVNFPTIRIAQFAALMSNVQFLFSKIKDNSDPKYIKTLLQSVPDDYWDERYRFDTEAAFLPKKMGEDGINLLMINAIAPLLFSYGRAIDDEKYVDAAITILDDIHAETNVITKQWKSLGIKVKSAFDSQALVHLKTTYCDLRRCLSCKIGNEIIKG